MASRRVPPNPPVRSVMAALGALTAALTAAGCVSMPTGGPTRSYPVTEGTDAQGQQYVQIVPRPPGDGWSPTAIVQGFLTASASYGNHSNVAREYLTPQENAVWGPPSSAIVYKAGPSIDGRAAATPGAKGTVTVQVTGTEQAFLQGYGSYSVPLASSPDESSGPKQTFRLVQLNGQWRISYAPPKLLLTSDSFQNDYQLRDLYFFDPGERYLVPDPVYVPLGAQPSDLMNGLVSDLISPPDDWLSGGATRTALPRGTKISSVTLDGVTAVVSLTGAIAKVGDPIMERVSAQLLGTLSGALQSGAGQTVQSVEVQVNGKTWSPPRNDGNPVQSPSQSSYSPATGGTPVFYAVDSAGYLVSRNGTGDPKRIVHIGTGFSQIAVSPDGSRLAALRGGILYASYIGEPLARLGTGYVSVSWDAGSNLWASAGTQIMVFRASDNPRRPLGQQVAVTVSNLANSYTSGPFAQLRVAPDGVRVALVIGAGSTELTFGAISGLAGPSPQITLSQVDAAPLGASTFTGLTWYGSDNVIALADPGPVVTEYPVTGGTPTPLPVDDGMKSITASWNNQLVTGLANGKLAVDKKTTTSWTTLGTGSSPAYPG
jgi:Lipoprotein LpqB beta-propeller domain/Sporulation and spore germination